MSSPSFVLVQKKSVKKGRFSAAQCPPFVFRFSLIFFLDYWKRLTAWNLENCLRWVTYPAYSVTQVKLRGNSWEMNFSPLLCLILQGGLWKILGRRLERSCCRSGNKQKGWEDELKLVVENNSGWYCTCWAILVPVLRLDFNLASK